MGGRREEEEGEEAIDFAVWPFLPSFPLSVRPQSASGPRLVWSGIAMGVLFVRSEVGARTDLHWRDVADVDAILRGASNRQPKRQSNSEKAPATSRPAFEQIC